MKPLTQLKSSLLPTLKFLISVQLVFTSSGLAYANNTNTQNGLITPISSSLEETLSPQQIELPRVETISFPYASVHNNAVKITYTFPEQQSPIKVEVTLVQPEDSSQVNQIGRWLEKERQLNGMHPYTLNLKPEQTSTAEHPSPPPTAYGEIEAIEIPVTAWEKFKFWAKEKSEKIHENINLIDIRQQNLRKQKILNKQTANDKLVRFLKAHPDGTTNGLAIIRAVGVGSLIYTAFTLSGSGELGTLINSITLGLVSGAFLKNVNQYKQFLGHHDLIIKNISRLAKSFNKQPNDITISLSTSRTFDFSMQATKYMLISASTLVFAHLIFALTGEPLIPEVGKSIYAIGIATFLSYIGQGIFENAFTTHSREQNKVFENELAKNQDPKFIEWIEHERSKSDLATKIKFFALALVSNAGAVLASTHSEIQGIPSDHLGQLILGSLGVFGVSYFTYVLAKYDKAFTQNMKIAYKSFKNSCSAFFSATNEALDKATKSQRIKSE